MKKKFKNALITGAGKRIGTEIAYSLCSDGWNVVLHYNTSKNSTLKLAKKLTEKFENQVLCLKANLSDYNDIKKLFLQIDKEIGTLSCLINNAAAFEYDSLQSTNLRKWDLHMNTNIRAPLFLSQLFAKRISKKFKANIINIIDQRVLNLTPHFMTYTISKAALWTLTQTLALSLAPNIRVNAIGPGPTIKSKRQTKKEFIEQCKRMPLEQGASPKEISQILKTILETPSMTGQIIALDGGQHLGWSQSNNKKFYED